MVKKEKLNSGYVKKETMLVVALVALIVGFVSGAVYSSFKFVEEGPMQTTLPPQQTIQDRGASSETAERIRALEKETSLNPNNAKAWTLLGDLYFDSNRYKKSIKAYKKSLEIDHNNADVWTDLGVMYRRSKQPDKAIEAFDKAIKVDPLHDVSRFNKGIVLMHDLNDPKGAIRTWEDLVKMNPLAKAPNGKPVKEMVEQFKKMIGLRGQVKSRPGDLTVN